jgi:hypothetical protein
MLFSELGDSSDVIPPEGIFTIQTGPVMFHVMGVPVFAPTIQLNISEQELFS